MRSSWLYLAMRSERDSEPVLIWPALVPTAMSAMVVSSVSPERWLITDGVAGALGHLDRGEGLGQRADLVDLDQDRVGDALVDAFLQDLGVGDEQVVADQLHLARRGARSGASSRPSRLRPCRPRSMMIGYLSHPGSPGCRSTRRRSASGLSAVERGTCRPCRTRWRRSRGRARSARRRCSRPCRSPRGSAGSPLRGWRRSARSRLRRRPRCSCPCSSMIFFSAWNTSAP